LLAFADLAGIIFSGITGSVLPVSGQVARRYIIGWQKFPRIANPAELMIFHPRET
jgi:hypothetical protein